jgi:hypothetical protein
MKAAWLLLPALMLGNATANARDVYCDMNGGGSPDRTREWSVVNANARKPQLPGQTKATSYCFISFESQGAMYRPIEIVTRPKLGEVKTGHNKLFYRSVRNGEDFVAIRMYRVGRSGGLESYVFSYRIHVVDKPL